MSHKDIKTIKFGEHLIFDAYGCNPEKLASIKFCTDLINSCVEITHMHKLIEPVIIEATPNTAVGGKDPGGVSGFVIIQESHISLHTFAKRGFITMDVYSCKQFEHEKLIDFLRTTLEAKDVDVFRMDRGLKYPTENLS